jgi:hypothetical protein
MTEQLSRRTFIGAASITALTGCYGTTDNTRDESSNDEPETTPRASVEITSTTLIDGASVTASESGQVPWAYVDVENTTEVDHGRLDLQLRFYDDADELMDTRRGSVELLPGETTWRHYQRFTKGRDLDEGRDIVQNIEADILEADRRAITNPPATADVVKSEMVAEPESGVTVTGEISTGETGVEGTLYVIAQVYDDAGRLRGTTFDSRDSLSANARWRFEASSLIRTPPDVEGQAADHEIILHAQ